MTCKQIKDTNCICREARVFLHPDAYNAFIDIAITDENKRADARKIWEGLASFYNELIKPLDNPADKT
jgi:hypothetical protein